MTFTFLLLFNQEEPMMENILRKYPPVEDSVIEILLEVQSTNPQHCVSEDQIKQIADHCQISESKVCSVISFYTLLSDIPKGKYVIQLCRDVPCYVSNSPALLKTLEKLLEIHVGETTENDMFTLEFSSCLGCCDKGPVMRINNTIYKNCTTDKVKAIISEYRGGHHV